MGSNLTVLRDSSYNRDSFILLKKSLVHLKENFCAFKALCEEFFLDATQFKIIFGLMDNTFAIWDNDKNGLIDALELFSGLIICADAKLNDKVRFLFEVFDLNEVDYLQAIEIQFMVYSVVTSVFKIFGIKRDVNVDEVEAAVNAYFKDPNEPIKVMSLIRFVTESPPAQEFFELIHNSAQELPNKVT